MKKQAKYKTVIYELKPDHPLTSRQKREIQKLAALPDEKIDASDIPELPSGGLYIRIKEAILDKEVVDRFRKLENELAKKSPNSMIEAEDLARRITDPQTAHADEIWRRTWTKPLYANTRVSIGTKWVQQLEPYMKGSWRHWGMDNKTVLIKKTGKGIARSSFELNEAAADIQRITRIAVHRLYAIQGAARALRARAAENETPYADLIDVDYGEMVPAIQQEMGTGWGNITVLHFLTDLGLACKPDRHLARTVQHLWPSLNLGEREVPSLSEAIQINQRVRWLVEELDGSFSPARLRYIDKILMEISKQGLIPNP